MEVVIVATASEVCMRAARIVASSVRRNPRAVLGLPTGETPREMYAELGRMHREEQLDFSSVTTFNLDELVGVPIDHPGSYHHYMQVHLFDHVNLRPERTHLPDGLAPDLATHCGDYEREIVAAGGIDLQILGIGADGHVGFNEPTSSLGSRTRLKTLTQDTLAKERVSWAKATPPRHVITMGVATILEARRCLMLAWGARKASAVARMVEGPLTAMVPASALQLHPRTTVIVDEDAAADLTLRDYYRTVFAGKPSWQRAEDGE